MASNFKCKELLCLIYSGVLFISGILIIAFSVILLYRIFYHFDFLPSSTVGPVILLLLLGLLHLCLTWLGIKGPQREHNFHIVLFIISTSVLLICEFAMGIWLMILWNEVSIEATELMAASFHEMNKHQHYSNNWAKLQQGLECCGLLGPDDYSTIHNNMSYISCTNHQLSNGTLHIIHQTGCRDRLVKYAENTLLKAAIMGFLSGAYQGLGLFLYCIYFQSLRETRSERISRRAELTRQASVQSQQGQNLITAPVSMLPLASPVPLGTPLVTNSP